MPADIGYDSIERYDALRHSKGEHSTASLRLEMQKVTP
jgi:hypothetical protein